MTEAEWLACTDPEPMLAFLRGGASARKLRLFASACSRRVWPEVDDLGRAAVEAAERFADGALGPEELRAARLACRSAGAAASWYAAASDPFIAAGNAARSARTGASRGLPAEQAALLREIFGNPFRPVAVDPAWLASDGGRVVARAQSIYDQRRFEALPLLADVLAAAGCQIDTFLSHCREAGPHVRGCWMVDLLLGKA